MFSLAVLFVIIVLSSLLLMSRDNQKARPDEPEEKYRGLHLENLQEINALKIKLAEKDHQIDLITSQANAEKENMKLSYEAKKHDAEIREAIVKLEMQMKLDQKEIEFKNELERLKASEHLKAGNAERNSAKEHSVRKAPYIITLSAANSVVSCENEETTIKSKIPVDFICEAISVSATDNTGKIYFKLPISIKDSLRGDWIYGDPKANAYFYREIKKLEAPVTLYQSTDVSFSYRSKYVDKFEINLIGYKMSTAKEISLVDPRTCGAAWITSNPIDLVNDGAYVKKEAFIPIPCLPYAFRLKRISFVFEKEGVPFEGSAHVEIMNLKERSTFSLLPVSTDLLEHLELDLVIEPASAIGITCINSKGYNGTMKVLFIGERLPLPAQQKPPIGFPYESEGAFRFPE